MTRTRSLLVLFSLYLMVAAIVSCRTAPDNRAPAFSPNTRHNPVDVVRIQLEALQDNGPNNDGIVQTFEFASPENRENTGPVERFITLFETPPYSAMLNHQTAEVFAPYVESDLAIVPVALVGADGTEWEYLFVLTRQSEPPYEDMWMTDAVQLESRSPSDMQPLPPERTI